MSVLRLETSDGVAVVTLDRPPANALNHAFFVEVGELLARLGDADVRAVVLTGTGRFFSAGLDLFEILDYDQGAFRAFAQAFDAAFCGLFGFPKPMVAAINGHAIAGGTVLAALCDFRLMADGKGRAGLTEIKVGVPLPVTALEPVRFACAGPHLPELLYGGATYEPREAAARRLVDRVVDAGELLSEAKRLAVELGAKSPTAFATIKRSLRAEALARMEAAHTSGDPVWRVWEDPETRAAMEAYRKAALEKR